MTFRVQLFIRIKSLILIWLHINFNSRNPFPSIPPALAGQLPLKERFQGTHTSYRTSQFSKNIPGQSPNRRDSDNTDSHSTVKDFFDKKAEHRKYLFDDSVWIVKRAG